MTRQTGRRILGLLWILDGVLELLPATAKSFISIIQGVVSGQPVWFQHTLNWALNLLSPRAMLWNDLLGVAEIGVGLLLLFSVSARLGIVLSIVLSIPIWIWGQGLGGILTGNATDPGAMPLYVLAAFLVWPRRADTQSVDPSAGVSTRVSAPARETVGSISS